MAEPISGGENIEKSVCVSELEKNIRHLILRQVLHLEVAFCCPDWPNKLENGVISTIKIYLKEMFEKELKRIYLKIKELRKEIMPGGYENQTMKLIKKNVYVEINKIWKWTWSQELINEVKSTILNKVETLL